MFVTRNHQEDNHQHHPNNNKHSSVTSSTAMMRSLTTTENDQYVVAAPWSLHGDEEADTMNNITFTHRSTSPWPPLRPTKIETSSGEDENNEDTALTTRRGFSPHHNNSSSSGTTTTTTSPYRTMLVPDSGSNRSSAGGSLAYSTPTPTSRGSPESSSSATSLLHKRMMKMAGGMTTPPTSTRGGRGGSGRGSDEAAAAAGGGGGGANNSTSSPAGTIGTPTSWGIVRTPPSTSSTGEGSTIPTTPDRRTRSSTSRSNMFLQKQQQQQHYQEESAETEQQQQPPQMDNSPNNSFNDYQPFSPKLSDLEYSSTGGNTSFLSSSFLGGAGGDNSTSTTTGPYLNGLKFLEQQQQTTIPSQPGIAAATTPTTSQRTSTRRQFTPTLPVTPERMNRNSPAADEPLDAAEGTTTTSNSPSTRTPDRLRSSSRNFMVRKPVTPETSSQKQEGHVNVSTISKDSYTQKYVSAITTTTSSSSSPDNSNRNNSSNSIPSPAASPTTQSLLLSYQKQLQNLQQQSAKNSSRTSKSSTNDVNRSGNGGVYSTDNSSSPRMTTSSNSPKPLSPSNHRYQNTSAVQAESVTPPARSAGVVGFYQRKQDGLLSRTPTTSNTASSSPSPPSSRSYLSKTSLDVANSLSAVPNSTSTPKKTTGSIRNNIGGHGNNNNNTSGSRSNTPQRSQGEIDGSLSVGYAKLKKTVVMAPNVNNFKSGGASNTSSEIYDNTRSMEGTPMVIPGVTCPENMDESNSNSQTNNNKGGGDNRHDMDGREQIIIPNTNDHRTPYVETVLGSSTDGGGGDHDSARMFYLPSQDQLTLFSMSQTVENNDKQTSSTKSVLPEKESSENALVVNASEPTFYQDDGMTPGLDSIKSSGSGGQDIIMGPSSFGEIDWPTKVETVATKVNYAFSRLRDLAAPYLSSDQSIPDAHTASGESDIGDHSQEPVQDCEGSLVAELGHDATTTTPLVTEEMLHTLDRNQEPTRDIVEGASLGEEDNKDQSQLQVSSPAPPESVYSSSSMATRSVDTTGKPPPAKLVSGSAAAAASKVGDEYVRPIAVHDPSISPRDVDKSSKAPTPVVENLGHDKKRIEDKIPDRAMTPLMRMRDATVQEAVSIPRTEAKEGTEVNQEPKQKQQQKAKKKKKDSSRELAIPQAATGTSATSLTVGDSKVRTPKKSKSKSKRTQQQRGVGKRGSPHKRKSRRSGSSRRRSSRRHRDSDEESTGSQNFCQDGLVGVIEKLVSTRCGQVEDTYDFEEEDEESNVTESSDDGESEEEEEDYDTVKNLSSPDQSNRSFDASPSRMTATGTPEASEGQTAGSTNDEVVTADEEDGQRTANSSEEREHSSRADPVTSSSEADGSGAQGHSTKSHEHEPTPAPSPTSPPQVTFAGEIDIHDKNFIKSFISHITRDGTPLIVHKRSGPETFTRPIQIMAFVQQGSRLANGQYSSPRLIWYTDPNRPPYIGVDLFDIKSLEKASALQLQQYPMAMPGRSLLLKRHRGPDYVFEAPNEAAALRFVHGVRWVVARLSFNLIIGNLTVSCELMDVDDQPTGNGNANSTVGGAAGTSLELLPRTPLEESQWTAAMNDVTNILVDKCISD